MWRFSELMPVDDPSNILSLGEGGTPLLEAGQLAKKLGLKRLLIKEEGLNPTGTFKARGLIGRRIQGLRTGRWWVYRAVRR